MSLAIVPITGLPEVAAGDDLGALLAQALSACAPPPAGADILVVTQKIVSKAEGRFVDLATVAPGPKARRLAQIVRKDPRLVELVLSESTGVVRAAPHILITRHRTGHVMANAGIDRSNLGGSGPDIVLLLPQDPDASAERLRGRLGRHGAAAPAVIVSDSFGRPWRNGVVNVAIGCAGLPSLVDRRGLSDRDGRSLEVTEIGFADLVACAAGLVMGEGDESVPAALVRGLDPRSPFNPAAALVRPLAQDLFQ